ncbi:MAG: YbgC/FadM family acyl-CoA thioesterase [Rhizobiales bacterium]|nr:YbgC/FadM family acyl-CoA thioesterase [Hyphomicrobiales bacterium]
MDSAGACAASGWPDLAGRLTASGHELAVRVYFEDTDFSGVAYHASHVRWMERGRSDYLRLLGVHHHVLHAGADGGDGAGPAAFVVRRLELDYLAPARIDDVLVVATRVEELASAYCRLSQEIRREGTVIARGRVQVVLVGASGRPLRIKGALREQLSR